MLGLAAVILWSVIGVTGYLNRVNDLSRMPVPGQITVQIPGAGEQFVYYEGYEGQGSASIGELGMRVTDPRGQTVALEPYGSTSAMTTPVRSVGPWPRSGRTRRGRIG